VQARRRFDVLGRVGDVDVLGRGGHGVRAELVEAEVWGRQVDGGWTKVDWYWPNGWEQIEGQLGRLKARS
jgi:hypothetical protein